MPNKHAHDRPLSVDEHEAEAERHNRVASFEEAAASGNERSETVCVGDSMDGVSRIGTEAIRFAHPCFTSVANPTAQHIEEARQNRVEARRHRNVAKELEQAEALSCSGLDEASVIHSPFSHDEDIQTIEALVEDGVTVGAKVTFRPVKGLSKQWLEKTLECHKARAAALGFPADYMKPHCFSSIQGVEFSVVRKNERVIVEVRGSDNVSAVTVLGRALDMKTGLPAAPRS